jgi:hypothetical protein
MYGLARASSGLSSRIYQHHTTLIQLLKLYQVCVTIEQIKNILV